MIPEQIALQAKKCLSCKNAPCSASCPLGIDIPAFIRLLKEDKPEQAFEKIRSRSIFGEICSAVCPLDKHCRSSCVCGIKGQPVEIPMLENYLFDRYFIPEKCACDKQCDVSGSVAVVGSGVAGLSCAVTLAQKGVDVTVYEKAQLGGITANEIPPFRLERKAFEKILQYATCLGVKFRSDEFVSGSEVSVLSEAYDAVFLACGLQKEVAADVQGNCKGVVGATEFLRGRCKSGRKTVVIGGGNVAMDCARTALRSGSEVTVVYRRTQDDMPAFSEEKSSALREGVQFKCLLAPFSVNGTGDVISATFAEMKVVGQSGGRSAVEKTGKLITIDCDTVIMAVGSQADEEFFRRCGLQLVRGRVEVDNDMMTSVDGLFAGGDIVRGENTVAKAVRDGRQAAEGIIRYIDSKKLSCKE